MTDFLHQVLMALVSAGISSPRLELRMMLGHILKQDSSLVGFDVSLSEEQAEQLQTMVNRRIKHTPLDKILGVKDFYKNTFVVDENVLTPRPDSETLVEAAINLARKNNAQNILEFGVGSGCLILSVLDEVKNLTGVGVDKSAKALNIAKINGDKLNLNSRIEWRQFDYFSDEVFFEKYSLIISNPPYIPSADVVQLDEEVRCHDPLMALDGGNDGYVHYRRLAEIVPHLLADGGYVLLEAGIGQADEIAKIFMEQGLNFQGKICDLGGVERCIILKK